jgi:hypothetical protein
MLSGCNGATINTTHSMSQDSSAQKLLDFVRKIVEDNRKSRYTGVVTIGLVFNQGGLRVVEHQTKVSFCLDKSDS